VNPVAGSLQAAIEETLEQVAFTPVMPVAEPFDWSAPDLAWASIRLEVALRGELVCAASAATLAALAHDAWGGDGGDVNPSESFLLEVANIIGGRLLATLFPRVEPALGLPMFGAGARAPGKDALMLCFEVEAGRIGVFLEIGAEIPELLPPVTDTVPGGVS
jgi:hypothetical protein